ncbi:zinc-dependent metalloprotease [Puia sp.]|jgi:hypothetical protein|uniref:zinc-dependent metalloprotease n=1 Tax=Puia sp. TaxID=2045100 RepID=UPI002F41B8E2
MKNVYSLILTVLLGLSALSSIAQPICGFDNIHSKRMREDLNYRKNVISNEGSIRTYLKQHPQPITRPGSSHKIVTGGNAPHTLSSGYTIPVVVHVINTGGDIGTIYNPTDAQILRAINYLNQVYNGTYPGTQGAGDLGIQFVLAQRDPNCNPTNGINRVNGSGVPGYTSGGVMVDNTTGGADELNIKALSRWDNTQYYNIWIVNKLDGNDGTSGQFIAGYAYFPGVSAAIDGIVMLATQMEAGQKTLPHEIGHAFNLYHPFEGSTDASQCPPNTDCSMDGDQVCDTPPISKNINSGTGVIDFSCRSDLASPNNINTCLPPTTLYTPATEYNYMNYTNCYNQFTLGQAARMQAAVVGVDRASLTTSSGGIAPSGGSCSVPKIDFELMGDRVAESTAASSGCRAYTDYTYNMDIGVGPSAAATATLSASGTAVQGLDFDITTNGNFATPSQQLTFAAGSTTAQAFTVRVYDDASVNGTRQFSLGFTVNNGGGNAVVGDGRPSFTMIIDDNDVAPTTGTLPNGTASIGSNQGNIPGPPFDATQTSLRTQFLYKASELTAAGVTAGKLSALSLFFASKNSTRPYRNMFIKLGTTSATYLLNVGVITIGSSMTTVKSLPSYSPTTGWNTFTFDNSFTWNGTSSVIVEICYENGAPAAGDAADGVALYVDGDGSHGNMFWQNSINCWENFSSLAAASYKPQARFNYGIAPNTVTTALNSQSQYLGPNADIYFYDQTNGQLMARIQNLSNLDYGCTQVEIDRAGSTATQFWNTNTANYLMDKTFHVIPTTNHSSGNYNITLYYTQAEVQGWQTTTGQTLSAIQLVKVPGQIFSVTPSDPTAAGTVTIVTPTITSFGTNTGLTYSFANGFSGFGAGIPSLTDLPITLLQFSGRLDNDDAVLAWSTSFEQNSAGFEVDRSYDGLHFSKIGYVPAAGNSTTEKDYTFTDPSLTTDSNFYQLKEISLDGRATYSKVILVRDPHASPSFTVLPNPFTTDIDVAFGHVPAGSIQIRVLDITGRELWRQTSARYDGNRIHVGLSGTRLASGVYLLEVRSATGTETQRIIKK